MSKSLFFSESLICSFTHKIRGIRKKNLTKIVFLVRFFVRLKKPSDSLIPSFLMRDVSGSLRSLTKNEGCERIAQVAPQKLANEQIAHFLRENH